MCEGGCIWVSPSEQGTHRFTQQEDNFMPHTKPCVLRIPLIAMLIFVALWTAMSYTKIHAYAKQIDSQLFTPYRSGQTQDTHAVDTSLYTIRNGANDAVTPFTRKPIALKPEPASANPIQQQQPLSITLQPASEELIQQYFGPRTQLRQLALTGPAILVTKTASLTNDCATTDPLIITETTQVFYCYVALNVGSTVLITHTVIDSQKGVLTANYHFPRQPGGGAESGAFFAIPVLVTETIHTSATWQSIDENQIVVSDTADALVVLPTLALTTSIGLTAETCDDQSSFATLPNKWVTVCYTVKNINPVTLLNHQLVDQRTGTILELDATPLAPGATRMLTRTLFVTETFSASATWYATTESGVPTSAEDRYEVLVPSIELRATIGAETPQCPETKAVTVTIDTMVTLCYLVRNTGGYVLDKHTISDTLYAYAPLNTDLLPGKSMGVTVTFPATESVQGVGEWRASGPKGLLVSARDTFSIGIRHDGIVEVYVFRDVNENGTKEDMEPGMEGVTVTLVSPNRRYYTVTTDILGVVRLENLPEDGVYTATVDMSAFPGYTQTTNKREVAIERGKVITIELGITKIGSDTDQDRLSDKLEGPSDYDQDGIANYEDLDSDNDGLSDEFEGNSDTNFDGRPNRLDTTRFLFLPAIFAE